MKKIWIMLMMVLAVGMMWATPTVSDVNSDRIILLSLDQEGVTGVTLGELFNDRKFITIDDNGKPAQYVLQGVIENDISCTVITEYVIDGSVFQRQISNFVFAGKETPVAIYTSVVTIRYQENGLVKTADFWNAGGMSELLFNVLYYDCSVPKGE